MLTPSKLFIVLFIIFFFTFSASAEWDIYKRIQIHNEESHFLRIEKWSSGKVYAVFILAKKKEGVFKSKLPVYKVDDNDIRDLNQKNQKGEVRTDTSTWLRWQLLDGKELLNGEFLEIIEGKQLIIQYYLPDGSIKETNFYLEGIKEAISEISK